MDVAQLAKQYYAHEPIEGAGDTFQRRARILQSMWRAEQGYEPATLRGRQLGSRLPMPWAEETLANFLTSTIRQVVRDEVLHSTEPGRLFDRPGVFSNLLSSQALCLNLLGELQRDLDTCSSVFSDLTRGRVHGVTALRFEYSPGRGDASFMGDNSAFDAYLEYEGAHGVRGFVAIGVKYHEDLIGGVARHRSRYDDIASDMGCFAVDTMADLRRQPLQRIWRDHLLAGSILGRGEFGDGFFVFLHPEGNRDCTDAVARYSSCLTSNTTFAVWTLESVVATVKRHTAESWIDLVEDRYLGFRKLERVLQLGTCR